MHNHWDGAKMNQIEALPSRSLEASGQLEHKVQNERRCKEHVSEAEGLLPVRGIREKVMVKVI